MHDPRGPTGGGGGGGGGPSRYPTFRPGGGGGGLDDSSGGRGGMVFEDPYRFRPTMSSSSGYGPGASAAAATGHATAHPSDFLPTSYGPGATGTTTPLQTHVSPPLRRPNYDATDFTASAESRQQNMMYSVPQRGGGGVDVGSYETTQEPNLYRSSNGGNGMYHAMNESGPFTSAATGAAAAGAGAAGPSSSSASNLKSAMKRNVGFEDATTGGPSMETEHLSRPRAEETARGETSAGALPDKRDGLGTL